MTASPQIYRRRRAFAILIAIALIAGLGSAAMAVTVGGGSDLGFEIDGNFVDNPGGGPIDWTNITPVMVTDDTADSGFTQGSKELEPGSWACGTGGANPNKGNIVRAYVNPRVSGAGAYVDLAFVAQNIQGGGDVHLNFEFSQDGTAQDPDDFTAGPCPIPRQADDLLVTYDFPGGTADPNIGLYKWVPGNPNGNWVDQNLPASAARAAVNQADVADPFDGTISAQRFGEATIDLVAALPADPNAPCRDFGFLNVRSRSSGESITSAIQDKLPTTAIDLSTCGSIKIHKVDDHVPPQALAGAVFGLWKNAQASGSPEQTQATDANGEAVFTEVSPGDYWIKEISAPAKYTADPDIVGPIHVAFRSNVDITQAFVDPRDVGNVKIIKKLVDENGRPVVPDDGSDLDGASFLIFKDANANGTYQAGEEAKLWPAETSDATCTVNNGSGFCTVGPLPTGTYGVHETAAPAGTTLGADIYPVSVVKDTTVEVDYVNSLSPLNITIDKSGPERAHRGDEIHYTFAATTSGPKLHDIVVAEVGVDRCDGAISGPTKSGGDQDAFLEVGETWTYGCDHVVTQGDPDPLPNEASVTGTDDFGRDVSDSDTHNVDILDPAITLDKKVEGADHKPVGNALLAHVGDALDYSVLITNTGDTTLEISALADTLKANLPASCTAGVGSTLAVGASITCNYTSTAAADAHNVASVTGVDSLGGAAGTVQASDETFVDVIHPDIEIVKTGTETAHEGDATHYSFEVTNTGDVTLTDISVDDDKLGHIGDIASLGVGASQTLTKKVDAPADDVTNVAEACGTDPLDDEVCDDDDHELDIIHPDIEIVKTGTAKAHEGDATHYTFEVTNTGDVDLTNVSVDDDKLGHIGNIASLPAGDSATLEFDSVAPADDITNVATACGLDPLQDEVCDDDDHELDVIHPAIRIVKTGAEKAHEGDDITYDFEVTNTGDVDLTDVSVDDDKLGHIGDIASLAVGASVTLHKTTDSPDADVRNVATACGVDPLQDEVCDDDDHELDVIHPGIDVVKTGKAKAHEGDQVTYTFTVTNTGDVPLVAVEVADDILGDLGTIPSLGVGASTEIEKTFTVPADTDAVDNVVEACGVSPVAERSFCDTDTHHMVVIHPAITLDKKLAGADHKPVGDALLAHEGEDLGYTVVITNTGDTALEISELEDSLHANLGVDCSEDVGDTLSVGEDITCAYTDVAGADDRHNVASVTGVDELGGAAGTVSASDETFADVIHPAIEIEKTGAETSHEGDTVTYSFKVTNTGDVDLSDVDVTDDVLGDIGTIDELAVGASETLTKDFVVPAGVDSIENVATACGTDPADLEVCDEDDHKGLVIHPFIEIVKTATPVSVEPGQTVTYTYDVTNTGDTTLTDVVVTDDKLGVIGTIDSLAPGETKTLSRAVVIQEDSPRTNIGTACGQDALNKQVCDDDDATISIVLPVPPTPRLPATGFRVLAWIALSMALIATGLAIGQELRERLRRQMI